jgi:membrane protease YdiL (CAAX protease family)
MMQYNTYILLFISVISLWFNTSIAVFRFGVFRQIRYWQLFIVLTLISGVYAHFVTARGVIALVIFYLILQQYKHNAYSREIKKLYMIVFLWLLIAGFALLFYLHKVPGFHNLLVMNNIKFTPDAIAFTMYLNLDKVIVGIMLMGMILALNQSTLAWRTTIRAVIIFYPIVAVVLLGLSYWFHYIIFEPKVINCLLIWSINNLFFVCLAEEALFRGFLQNSLSRFNYPYSGIAAIFIAAILFGLLHAPGGIKYVILATVAGLFYGYIYYKTKSIEASILTHFMVNLTHILFFTYPALEYGIN